MEKDEGIGVSELEIVTGRKELEDEGTPDKIKNNENTNKQTNNNAAVGRSSSKQQRRLMQE